jgi:uncharacterized membrane protein
VDGVQQSNNDCVHTTWLAEAPQMMRNFFPQDTRIVEICSAVALLISAAYSAAGEGLSAAMIGQNPAEYWAVLLLAFGSAQLSGLFFYPKAELLRTLMAWVSGMLWCWVALSGLGWMFTPDRVLALMVGIGNLYAFSINTNKLRISWRD